MTVTQAQLQTVMHFTLGAQTHRVKSYTASTTLERTGIGHDTYRRFTYSIDTELEGSSLSNLKAQLDSAKSGMIGSGSDFALFRSGTKVHEHLAVDCRFGPVASINIDGVEQSGLIESIVVTVECLVPVNVSSGVIDHAWTEQTVVDDEAQTTSIVRTGTLISVSGTSAKVKIEEAVPAQPAGYDRTIDIRTDDTDTSATYTLTDRKTDRRNYDVNVRDHKWTKTTLVRQGVLEEVAHAGTVRMAEGQSARAFIEANLPAGVGGFAREYRIDSSDDDRGGSYTVTDRKAVWSSLPGIEEASVQSEEATDEQGRVRITRSGRLRGSNAQIEMNNIRAALSATARIVSQTVSQDYFDSESWTFSFTAVATSDGSDIVFWQEGVTRRGGKKSRLASVYPDREPFFYFAETQPIVVEIIGRALCLRAVANNDDRYVKAPLPPILDGNVDYAEFQSGDTDAERVRLDDHHCQTTWRMLFLVPAGTPIPLPRGRIAEFDP